MARKKYIKSEIFLKFVRVLPIILMLCLTGASIYIFVFAKVPFDRLLNYTPSNYPIAIISISFFYALKSLSVIFPIAIVYAFVGRIFPIWAALPINLLGLTITMIVPYIAGRLSAAEYIQKFTKKYDKSGKIEKMAERDQFFASYMLRVVSFLPADIVSMILGSMRFDFKKYLIGSVAGSIPSMIGLTCMGATITDPSSPGFIISTIATIIISVVSVIFHKYKS